MMTKFAPLASGLGLALSLTMGVASDTRAMPVGPLHNTNNCIYAGKTCSAGSVIYIGGQKCERDGGEWGEARMVAPDSGSEWQRPGTLPRRLKWRPSATTRNQCARHRQPAAQTYH